MQPTEQYGENFGDYRCREWLGYFLAMIRTSPLSSVWRHVAWWLMTLCVAEWRGTYYCTKVPFPLHRILLFPSAVGNVQYRVLDSAECVRHPLDVQSTSIDDSKQCTIIVDQHKMWRTDDQEHFVSSQWLMVSLPSAHCFSLSVCLSVIPHWLSNSVSITFS